MKYIVVFLCVFLACSNNTTKNEMSAYLGETPPGTYPKIFAPGKISTCFNERCLVFSPDGNELFYEKWGWPWSRVIVHMKVVENKWSELEMASFSGVPDYEDGSPCISYDGQRLFYSSKNPMKSNESKRKDSDIFVVEKKNDTWTNLRNLGPNVNSEKTEGFMSISSNGNLYFESNREGSEGWDIWFSKWENNEYSKAERLPAPINTKYFDGHPCISKDESYLVMTSNRPGDMGDLDIWVSFKNNDGSWSEPQNLGERVNSTQHEADPVLSHDGKYLFWMSERKSDWPYEMRRYDIEEFEEILKRPGYANNDIYWISTEVIEELRPTNKE